MKIGKLLIAAFGAGIVVFLIELVVGAVFGTLSICTCCCLIGLLGNFFVPALGGALAGVFAVLLLHFLDKGSKVTPGDGAIAGVSAALIAFLLSLAVTITFSLLGIGVNTWLATQSKAAGAQAMTNILVSLATQAVFVTLSFVIHLLLGAVGGALTPMVLERAPAMLPKPPGPVAPQPKKKK